jgi:hypothetical protein
MDELRQYFREHHVNTETIAQKTGYSVGYIRNLLNGSDGLNDKARFRLMMAFPETQPFLLPVPCELAPEPDCVSA